MRKRIVAGNWKMNKTLKEGIELAKEIEQQAEKQEDKSIRVIIGTPFIHLPEVSKVINHNLISIAAQNCSSEPKGAFTGEVSAEMIKSTGTEYVIIGHSERRSYFNEDNKTLNKKVKLALESNLNPIFCIGELLDERKHDKQFAVVNKQLNEGLFDLTDEEFGILVVEDADDSLSQFAPVINKGDKEVLSVQCAASPGAFAANIPERTDVFGRISPEIVSPCIITFTTPASYNEIIMDLQ